MSAFGDKAINDLYAQGLTEDILAVLIGCCAQMKTDAAEGNPLPSNNENKITNRLFHFYLESEHIHKLFYFELQPQENYNLITGRHAGIGDIRVKPWNMLTRPKAYFIIECKRIDGTPSLNREYIKEGVQRFIGETPKYTSYYGRSIMLGYVVSPINIQENAIEIDAKQAEMVEGASVGDLVLIRNDTDWCVYSCQKTFCGTMPVALDHLFYDFSAVVQST